MNADLQAFRPRPENGLDYGEGSSSGFGAETQAHEEPRFPKSLYLVRPLFSAYDLNPVALGAQASVPIPEGLDLDAWIVPPPRENVEEEALEADEDAANVKVKKIKKGKGKAVNGGKSKKKKRYDLIEDELTPAPPETEEESMEHEKVSVVLFVGVGNRTHRHTW